jgi:hypothetical protein
MKSTAEKCCGCRVTGPAALQPAATCPGGAIDFSPGLQPWVYWALTPVIGVIGCVNDCVNDSVVVNKVVTGAGTSPVLIPTRAGSDKELFAPRAMPGFPGPSSGIAPFGFAGSDGGLPFSGDLWFLTSCLPSATFLPSAICFPSPVCSPEKFKIDAISGYSEAATTKNASVQSAAAPLCPFLFMSV